MNFDLSYWFKLIWNIHFFYALTITILTTPIIAYRYKILLNYFNEKISLLDSFFITYANNFLSYLSPFRIGTVFTKPLITKFFSKILIRKSVPVTIFEQIFEFGWQIILLFILLIFIGEKFLFNNILLEIILFCLVIFILIIALLNHEKVISFLWRFKNLLPRKIKEIGRKANLNEEKMKESMGMIMTYA